MKRTETEASSGVAQELRVIDPESGVKCRCARCRVFRILPCFTAWQIDDLYRYPATAQGTRQCGGRRPAGDIPTDDQYFFEGRTAHRHGGAALQ
jgi:hypothetical protein